MKKYVISFFLMFLFSNKVFTETTVPAFEEVAKWQYIQKYFLPVINMNKFEQKIGKFLSKNSKAVAISTVVPNVLISGFLIIKILEANGQMNDNHIMGYLGLPLAVLGGICIGIYGSFKIDKLLSSIGNYLENKDGLCLILITSYLRDWDKNKEKTPRVLLPLFEKLIINDNLGKIDKVFAQKLVEKIFAEAFIAEFLK